MEWKVIALIQPANNQGVWSVYKQYIHHCVSVAGRRPGRVVDSSSYTRREADKFTAGLKTGLCKEAYAFLSFITLSGKSRKLPDGRKPGLVEEVLQSRMHLRKLQIRNPQPVAITGL
jgi:hypothetical protein